MALPHRTLLLPYVRNATPSIESALARASARSRLAPLVRALGLEPRKAPIPPDARGAFALAGAEQVRGLAVIGERGGLVVLLIELAGDLTAEAVATTARRVRAHDAARPYLFLFAAQRYRRLAFASFGLDGELRHLAIERVRPRASELEALDEMVAAEGEGGVALALRRARTVDRTRVTRQFFRDFRAQRGAVGEAWTGIPADARAEREQLALLCALRLWLAMAVGSADGEAEVSVHGEVECATFPGQSAAWPRPAHRPRASPTHSPMPTGHAPADRHITNGPPDRYASIPPLPNLDRRIRQGDALVDPLDLVAWPDGAVGGPGSLPIVAADATVRQAIRAIGPLAERYLAARPEEKPELQRRLARAETELASAWISALDRRLRAIARELRADAATRDLFGERPPVARAAEAALEQTEARFAELGRLRTSLEVAGALPFFSFGVHFAEAAEHGFDLILSNPPWVRAHRWPTAVNSLVRRRYAVCRSPGWRRGAELAGAPVAAGAQADLALLFLERSLRRLAPGGVLAMLLPAKMLRSMYGAGGRRLLLEETELIALEDHSLDQRAIVRADAFAAAVVARKRAGVAAVGIAGRGSGDDAGSLDRTGPPGGAGIRTADAPPAGDRGAVIGAAAAQPAGDRHPTGQCADKANQRSGDVCRVTMTRRDVPPLRFEAKPRLGDLVSVRAEGYDAALLLAARFNSLPVRTFARAIAERAKGARFRFQAWTMALVPLPPDWAASRAAKTLLRISRDAHGAGAITPARQRDLDLAVAGLYGLESRDMEALAEFDRWLRGQAEAARSTGGRR